MTSGDITRYGGAHGEISLRMGAPEANRILLAIERLDQEGGIDPAFGVLRERLKTALVTKSSGDTDSAPSTE
jgi:hypothetical protein